MGASAEEIAGERAESGRTPRWRRLAAGLGARLGAGGREVVDIVLPPRCPRCRDIVATDGGFCGGCLAALALIARPFCDGCALPFPAQPAAPEGERLLCGRCLASPLALARTRAALLYDDVSRPLILAMKHGDRTLLDRAFAGLMIRAGRELLAEADLLVPVPLHGRRIRARRYNQAALLVHRLAAGTGRSAALDGLERRRATPRQGGLGREQRFRNLAGALAVPEQRREAVRGKAVLVVDDVMTTGATLDAAAKALRRAGAARVDGLVLARVAADPG